MDNCKNIILSTEKADIHMDSGVLNSCVVVMHLHYLESVSFFLRYAHSIPYEMNLIFTCSSKDVHEEIDRNMSLVNREYIVIEKNNRGRDISALLVACRTTILQYKYVCFLHDKKEKNEMYKLDTQMWIEALWENMLQGNTYIQNVLNYMEKEERVGLMVPPPPLSSNMNAAYRNAWWGNEQVAGKLLKQMGIEEPIYTENHPIALGTVFWAKVDALKPLLEIDWKYEDFDEEPLKDNGTVSHAIERILPNVAASVGYETKVLMNTLYAAKRMQYMNDVISSAFDVLGNVLDIDYIFELEKYEEEQKKVLRFVDKFPEFYIYGAGNYGMKCLSMLSAERKCPKAFLVSLEKDAGRKIRDIDVRDISTVKFDEKIGILIAVSKEHQQAMLDKIKERKPDFNNVCIFRE